jgi:coiled-coil domain-containing protein 77
LSDAHNFLFEERQRLLALQAENDNLRLQEVQDRQRIQQLLSITQPLEQEITYHKETMPQSMTLLPRKQGARQASSSSAAAAAAGRPSTQERVMRTVFLPTANADFLLLKVESLQAQVNEQVRSNRHSCCTNAHRWPLSYVCWVTSSTTAV